MQFKKCPVCLIPKLCTDFNRKRRECKPCERGTKLQYRYNLTIAEYDKLFEQQNGRCKICDRTPVDVGPLVVDHDHNCCDGDRTCGFCVRGLLCNFCNTSIGSMQDSVDRMIKAIEYLQTH